MSSRTEQRKSAFKKGIDAEEARQKRRDVETSIRKGKREENLLKKRREGLDSADTEAPAEEIILKEGDLTSYVAALNSSNQDQVFQGAQRIRKLLSVERNPPIQQVIASGAVARFVQLLASPHSNLVFECAWALTNVASGTSEQTQFVVKSGAIPAFIELLRSSSDEVRDQAVWALGNIAGDGHECRDYLLQCGILPNLAQVFVPGAPDTLIRNATWTISNLCRGKPAPNFEAVRLALPLIYTLLHSQDMETVVDACWTASYMCDGPNEKIQEVINAGIAPQLVHLTEHHNPKVHVPALRAVGNIVTGDESHTQVILNCNPFKCFAKLLTSANKGVKKETCWAISNITAGSESQIQAVIAANVFPTLIQLMEKGDFDVRREASWAVGNAISGGTKGQIAHLVSLGCLKPMADLLNTNDTKIVLLMLSTLETLLKAGRAVSKSGEEKNKYVELAEEAGISEQLDELQNHENKEIYEKSIALLEAYFGAEEEENNHVNENVNGGNKITNYMFSTNAQRSQNNAFSF